MLAYRAEDINQRLVPHELYIREELERSVQFDVSNMSLVYTEIQIWIQICCVYTRAFWIQNPDSDHLALSCGLWSRS